MLRSGSRLSGWASGRRGGRGLLEIARIGLRWMRVVEAGWVGLSGGVDGLGSLVHGRSEGLLARLGWRSRMSRARRWAMLQ